MFAITSRYWGLPTANCRLPDGRTVTYVRRRFVPHPEDLADLGEHVVAPGERLDRIAFAELGDAELAWQLADANRALDPDELLVTGRRLRITLPAAAGPATGSPLLPGAARG
ncbi:LysM domain-containing protein [Kitasatospora sp. NPDC059327]|uniref:LysM domain-containing protein n=1 Tax=Kitasatospora sp. NPDC059327 TaxID=3346803 RepID=UPI0036861F43